MTKFLTATSRPLTLAFNLDSKTVISHHGLSRYLGMGRPFGECLLLHRYPLLLYPHLHEFIGCGMGRGKVWDVMMVEAVTINDALLYYEV